MNRRPRSVNPLIATVIATIAAPTAALATDGSLYYEGPAAGFSPGPNTTVTQPQPGVYQVSLPALTPAVAGDKWAMAWGCPAGTQAESVNFGALRLNLPSAMGISVKANASGNVFTMGDVSLPQSPNPGGYWAIAIPPGSCSVSLSIFQGYTVNQHARTYWIAPSVRWRDITPPSTAIRTVTAGWINAGGNAIHVAWGAYDNMGADGLAGQRILVNGALKWAGVPGQGEHAVDVDLNGVVDGWIPVVAEVDGDGTPGASSASNIAVDRTAPTASAPTAIPTGDAGTSGFSWSVADNFSGVSSSTVEVNSATDGSATGAWIGVGTPVAGPGVREIFYTSVRAVPDGLHATRVRVVDVAGNVAYGPAGRLVVDTTPPTVRLDPPPAQPVRAVALGVHLSDNLAWYQGLGATVVEANTAPDGSTGGSWLAIGAPRALTATDHVLDLDLAGLSDGPHALRVTTANGGPYGERLTGSATVTVDVDRTSPTLTDVTFTRTAPDRFTAAWIATDARAGVGSARVEWRDGTVWRQLATTTVGDGAGSLVIDTTQLPSGSQSLRLVVADRAGNQSVSTGTTGDFVIDHGPPGVTGLRLSAGPPWMLTWDQTTEDGTTCPTRLFVNGPGTSGAWHEVTTVVPAVGTHTATVPTDGLAPGAYRVRLELCDAVGNTTAVETAGLQVAAPSATTGGGVAGGPDGGSTLQTVVADLTVAGGRARTIQGTRVITVVRGYGGSVVVRGTVRSDARRAIGRTAVVVSIDGASAVTVRTDDRGRFVARLRARRGGAVRVTIATAPQTPLPTPTQVRIKVRPLVTLRASSTTAVAFAAPITFSGRLSPSPRTLGRPEAKTVILEWRDPVRRVWRPVTNVRTDADGRFAVQWRFTNARQRVPFRVRVPFELGWGLEAARSGVVTVGVR